MEANREMLTSFRVSEGNQHSKKDSNCCAAHDLPVTPVWVYPDSPFAHVGETLCYVHHEETIQLLVIVASKLAKHLCESSIVGARAHQAHGHDRVKRNSKIIVMTVF